MLWEERALVSRWDGGPGKERGAGHCLLLLNLLLWLVVVCSFVNVAEFANCFLWHFKIKHRCECDKGEGDRKSYVATYLLSTRYQELKPPCELYV